MRPNSTPTFLRLTATAAALSISLLAVVSAAHAQVSNGDFETGNMNGWITSGTATAVTTFTQTSQHSPYQSTTVKPNGGNYMAQMSTADSGNTSGFTTQSNLESFLGLASGSLDATGLGNATDGSAIKQSLNVTAGQVLSFDWNFLTTDYGATSNNGSDYADYSFFSITSSSSTPGVTVLSSSNVTGNTAGHSAATGWKNVSYTFTKSGLYTLGFGSLNVVDDQYTSSLLVDNVSLKSIAPPAVPEPGIFVTSGSLMMMTGIAVFKGRRRERRKRSAAA